MRSRLLEFQEENSALQSKITSLRVTSHGATEQEKLIGDFISLIMIYIYYCIFCIDFQAFDHTNQGELAGPLLTASDCSVTIVF